MKQMLMGLVLVPCMALATTWYVDGTNGTDENPGTSPDAAKATIQAAIDAAGERDVILVAEGVYAPIQTNNKLITIDALGLLESTVIDGNHALRCVTVKPEGLERAIHTNTVIKGFTLRNGRSLEEGHNAGVILGGIAEGCVITGGESRGGGGACETLLRNCLVCNNYAQYNAGGTDGCVLINCTIVGNRAEHHGGACCNSVLHNCIVYGNVGWTQEFDGRGLGWTNPLIESYSPYRANVCTDDPRFVDAANGDYRLAANSPCIDAGNNQYVASDTDLDGFGRIANGIVDIGCYEFESDGGPYVEKVGDVEWTYMIKKGRASIGDGVGAAVANTIVGAASVPSKLRQRPVVAIDNNAFVNCTNMTSVTIPASVKTIGASAFEGCRSLKDVYFEGDAISSIGADAFRGCHWNLIMHVPETWQGRGRTICGYSVWKGDEPPCCTNYVFTTVTNHVYHHDVVTNMTAYHTTVTNVYVHYVKENEKPAFILPSSYDTGFVNVVAEVEGGYAVIPATWSVNYPGFTEKYGNDFSKALSKPNGKYDRRGNPMYVWQDYVAGTNPMDETDVFDATIAIEGGKVVVSHTPELDADREALRKYTVYGKKNLMDSEWQEVEPGEELNYNFYRVTVRMK